MTNKRMTVSQLESVRCPYCGHLSNLQEVYDNARAVLNETAYEECHGCGKKMELLFYTDISVYAYQFEE